MDFKEVVGHIDWNNKQDLLILGVVAIFVLIIMSAIAKIILPLLYFGGIIFLVAKALQKKEKVE